MLLKAQKNLVKDILSECQFASYSQDAMKASNTNVVASEKKTNHEILMEKILKEIDPPSPIKPNEKAITYTIPKRKKTKQTKKEQLKQESTNSDKAKVTDWE